jgi:hypothetical protein
MAVQFRWMGFLLALPACATFAADKSCIVLTTSVEMEQAGKADGDEQADAERLVPADKVPPGVEVIYTVSAANVCDQAAEEVAIDKAMPDHVRYVPGSAIAPGADVSFSVDGGFHYESAEKLAIVAPDGTQRPAVPADYTNIRWQLRKPLAAGAVVLARFRAVFE